MWTTYVNESAVPRYSSRNREAKAARRTLGLAIAIAIPSLLGVASIVLLLSDDLWAGAITALIIVVVTGQMLIVRQARRSHAISTYWLWWVFALRLVLVVPILSWAWLPHLYLQRDATGLDQMVYHLGAKAWVDSSFALKALIP